MEKKLSREELIELVKKLMNFKGTEEESIELLQRIEANVLDPYISDYIFWSKPELTAEEVVDKALAYKPIILPAPGSSE